MASKRHYYRRKIPLRRKIKGEFSVTLQTPLRGVFRYEGHVFEGDGVENRPPASCPDGAKDI